MKFFRKSETVPNDTPKNALDAQIEQVGQEIVRETQSRDKMRGYSKWAAVGMFTCAALLLVVKAPVFLEALPLFVIGYGVTKWVQYGREKNLNKKYELQAQLYTLKEQSHENAPKPSPDAQPAPQAASEFATASRIGELEKKVDAIEQQVTARPATLEKPKFGGK